MTVRADDVYLDDTERWARDRLEPLLRRPMRVIDRSRKAGPPGLHDFETHFSTGPVAAIEITSEVEPERLSVESEIRRRGLSSFPLPGLTSRWLVRLTDHARVRVAGDPGALQPLLRDLEALGVQRLNAMSDYRDPFVQRLRALGIAAVYRWSSGRGGSVMVGTDAYGGFAWDRPAIDAWLAELLVSGQGISKLKKLGRADAAERHLVIVLDSFSQPGIGIPLGLSSRHEPGAAPYIMPSSEPPKPLTHLVVLPMTPGSEGLRWTHDRGWAVVPV